VKDQTEAIINIFDYSYNRDRPHNSTIGPAFWESFHTIPGLKYIFGLNFVKNDADAIPNLQNEVEQTLARLPPKSLFLFELGNENDDAPSNGDRPRNWTQYNYVDEWVERTRHIQNDKKSLRFFAPSFGSFSNGSPNWFSARTLWNATYNYNRDGWIDNVSQHG
jgi:hypothetical protein